MSELDERPGLPRCYVVGTGFEGRAKIIRKHCREDMDVKLKREPNNPHDANTVAVWIAVSGFFGTRKKRIGYLKRSHAKRIAAVMNSGYRLWAEIDNIYDPEGREHPDVKLRVGYE